MGNTPLDFERGITQWRIRPLSGPPYDGSYVWVLGYDGLVDRIEDLAYNDYIQVSQSILLTNVEVITAKVRVHQPNAMPSQRNISQDLQFIAGTMSSPGHRIAVPKGVSEADIGRTVTVTGATNGANNGDLKIVGIADPITAYVNKVVVTEGPRAAIVAIEKGARWKLSMLVENPVSTLVERARVVQESSESSFYRSDLKMNVARLTGTRNIHFRMTLIEHNPTNLYAMP